MKIAILNISVKGWPRGWSATMPLSCWVPSSKKWACLTPLRCCRLLYYRFIRSTHQRFDGIPLRLPRSATLDEIYSKRNCEPRFRWETYVSLNWNAAFIRLLPTTSWLGPYLIVKISKTSLGGCSKWLPMTWTPKSLWPLRRTAGHSVNDLSLRNFPITGSSYNRCLIGLLWKRSFRCFWSDSGLPQTTTLIWRWQQLANFETVIGLA